MILSVAIVKEGELEWTWPFRLTGVSPDYFSIEVEGKCVSLDLLLKQALALAKTRDFSTPFGCPGKERVKFLTLCHTSKIK